VRALVLRDIFGILRVVGVLSPRLYPWLPHILKSSILGPGPKPCRNIPFWVIDRGVCSSDRLITAGTIWLPLKSHLGLPCWRTSCSVTFLLLREICMRIPDVDEGLIVIYLHIGLLWHFAGGGCMTDPDEETWMWRHACLPVIRTLLCYFVICVSWSHQRSLWENLTVWARAEKWWKRNPCRIWGDELPRVEVGGKY